MDGVDVLWVPAMDPSQFPESVIPARGGRKKKNFRKEKRIVVQKLYAHVFSWRMKETITLKYQLNWTDGLVIIHPHFFFTARHFSQPSSSYC
jgi:hypothetical protein